MLQFRPMNKGSDGMTLSSKPLIGLTQTTSEVGLLPKTYRVITLGCRTNQYESGAYMHQLQQLGWKSVGPEEGASVGIINTCTVTASADSHSRHAIRQLARDNPGMQIWVTGCLAERDPEGLRQIEGVTAVVSNLEKEFLVNYLLPEVEVPEFNIQVFEGHTRAFVKVQDGCNSFCSYCVIPYVRGRSRSRSIEDILREVQGLLDRGYQEIVLTGINIGDFDGGDGKSRLVDLVKEVDSMRGVKRLRLSSIDPDEVDDDLQNAILKGRSCCPSMHIVLQSGSNYILKRMGRKYTRQIFEDTCLRLKAARSDFTFTTDIIVGFPGETLQDFEQTLQLVQEIQFAKVHMFPYSSRPQTKAARFTDCIEPSVIQVRKEQLMRLSEQVAFDLRSKYIGYRLQILTEEISNGHAQGHTSNFLRVKLPDVELLPNQLVEVFTVGNDGDALIATLI